MAGGGDGMSAESVIDAALAKFIKGADRRVDATNDVASALESAGHLWEDGWVESVEIHNARVAVETIETYGLVIELDAHGNAVSVTSPYGFMVIE